MVERWATCINLSALAAKPMIHSQAEFAYGAGHVTPLRALNPGLVYDAKEADYVKFLCGQGYSNKTLRAVTSDKSTCTRANSRAVWDLNYPSFAASTSASGIIYRTFRRTVTNVGSRSSVYRAAVFAPAGLMIRVTPRLLYFKSLGQKRSYRVTVMGRITKARVSASLIWSNGAHQVRSPIVVFKA